MNRYTPITHTQNAIPPLKSNYYQCHQLGDPYKRLCKLKEASQKIMCFRVIFNEIYIIPNLQRQKVCQLLLGAKKRKEEWRRRGEGRGKVQGRGRQGRMGEERRGEEKIADGLRFLLENKTSEIWWCCCVPPL